MFPYQPMKWWQQVKNIFQNDVPATLEALGPWLEQRQAAVFAEVEFQSGIRNYLESLCKQREMVEQHLERWDLDSIEDRKLLQSLRFLRTSVQETVSSIYFTLNFTPNNQNAPGLAPTLPEVLRFHTLFSKKLEQLLQYIEQNYPSLPFPLLDYLVPLHRHNGDFRNLLQKSAVLKLDLVQQHYLQLHACQERRSWLLSEVKDKRRRLEQAQHKLQEKEADLTKLKAEPQYQEWHQQEQKRKELTALRNEITNSVYTFFSVLAPALSSYQRFHSNGLTEIVGKYLQDSVGAFSKDENLEIIQVLQVIGQKIHAQEIQITLNQATAATPLLEKAAQGFLPQLQKQLASVKKELQIYSQALRGKDFLLKVEEAAYRVEHFRLQAERLAAETGQGEEKLAQLQEQELQEKQQLQQQFKAFYGKELRLA